KFICYCSFFFFSSRRRHTRFSRDWSSDVCSSDLASGPDQVRPLLPAGTGSRVLVTSRTQLTGLVAREGAIRIHLDALPPGDAHKIGRASCRERGWNSGVEKA